MPKPRHQDAVSGPPEHAPAERPCDFPGCGREGLHRAPRSRDHLTEYYWFCLEHVRLYNSGWDYCAGLSTEEIEALIRRDTTWQRPSWPLGSWHTREQAIRDRVYAGFMAGDAEADSAAGVHANGRSHPPTEEEKAIRTFGLSVHSSFEEIKSRYRELVKIHHPDTNGGDKAAEERLKTINQAYTTLKAWHGM